MSLLPLALVTLLTLQASPPPPSRYPAGVLLLAQDAAAEAAVPRLSAHAEEALAHFPKLEVKRGEALLGLEQPAEAEAALKRAELGFQESLIAFDARKYDLAERKLRDTLREFPNAAAAMKSCGHYCDALAMFAAVLQKQGELEQARTVLMDLVALSRTHELSTKRFDRPFISLRALVSTSKEAAMRGSVEVRSRPAGARVFVDGAPVGHTPLTLPPLAVGKHLLRLERPGHRVHGEVLDVTPDDKEVDAQLRPTVGALALEPLEKKLRDEWRSGKLAATTQTMGRLFGLERAVVGVARELKGRGGVEVLFIYADVVRPGRFSHRRVVFQGDEYGQLGAEVTRTVTGLLNEAGTEKPGKASDPLKHRAGTEDWADEDRGGKAAAAERAKKKRATTDPLDAVSGTEDW